MIRVQVSHRCWMPHANGGPFSVVPLALLALLHATSLLALSAQEATTAEEPPFPRGVVVKSVTCTEFPDQSYALFLPSSYSPDRPAPIIYAFDPAARGWVPVELLKDAAEKHGYIVVGSNNSRNGPIQLSIEAAQAMSRDTIERFSIDHQRIYFTGFSGGARVATLLAFLCDCAAGVISHGAGFPGGTSPESPIKFNYLATIGNFDFNFPEVIDVAAHLDANGSINRLWQFEGTHQWAPPAVWEEALLWMELQTLRKGGVPREENFIAQQLARATKRARNLQESGDIHNAVYEYRKMVQDFSGLADTAEFKSTAATLAETKAYRRATKQQEDEIGRQRRIVGEFLSYLDLLRTDPANRHEALHQIRRLAGEWKSRLEKKGEAEKDVVLRRALGSVFASAYEGGENALRENEPLVAALHFEVAGAIASESPMPLFQLARAHALDGNTKAALRALHQAVEKGFSYPELLRQTDEFVSLQGKKEFRDILAELEQQSPSQP